MLYFTKGTEGPPRYHQLDEVDNKTKEVILKAVVQDKNEDGLDYYGGTVEEEEMDKRCTLDLGQQVHRD